MIMQTFHFLRPEWLWALLPLILLLWQFWHRKYSSRSWQAVCDSRLLPYILIGSSERPRKWPVVLLAITTMLVVLALAGPAWKKLEQPVFREQSALVIALDMSRSMDATDLRPSRLARARHKIIDILNARKEGQTALIVFAADAYTVSPLTQDADTIVTLVKTLNTGMMPSQGSRIQKALTLATELLQQAGVPEGHILLITDSIEKWEINDLADFIQQSGHQLSVLGVGTAQGAPIAIEGGGFLKDQSGAIVMPKLDQSLLRQLARKGGGSYHSITADDQDLNTLLAGIDSRRIDGKQDESSFMADSWREEGPWLLLLVLPVAALAFRRGYLIIVIVLSLPFMPRSAYAFDWNSLWVRPDQQASELLKQEAIEGDAPSAALFSDPEWQAAAYYRSGEYQKSIDALQGIETADAYYNRGNAFARLGKLQQAIKAYDQALEKEPEHEDAIYNREQVEQVLEKQESSDSQSSDQSDSQQGDSQDSQDSAADSRSEQDQGQKENSSQGEKGDQQERDMASNEQHGTDSESKDATKGEQQDGQESDEEVSQQAQNNNDGQQQEQQRQAALSEYNEQTEETLANEQWLRRIPDDPGGLLRRKFKYQYQRQQQNGQAGGEIQPW